MADEEKGDVDVDTLGIPIRHFQEDKEPNLIEEAENMAKTHKPVVFAIFIAFAVIFLLAIAIQNLIILDILAAVVVVFFVFWVALMSDAFTIYKYMSIGIMFLIFLVYMLFKIF